ncbi:MAG: thermonuclease family protein [Candidatus Omnitrophota bacterium]
MNRRLVYLSIVVVFAALVMIASRAKDRTPDAGRLYVTRVVDGDTILLSNGERVRLIGIDTPEVHHSRKLQRDAERSKTDIETIQALGARSKEFTERLCLNRIVTLEFDAEKHDRYDRLLAYVYRDDGTFVNAKIVQEGFAKIMTIPPNVRHAALFRDLQEDARRNRRGLWAE